MGDALRFLTVIPTGQGHRRPSPRSLVAFPVVGGLVGLIWAGTAVGVVLALGQAPAAAAVLCVDALLTGGLHLDAVADVADGAASHAGPERAVAIMREPAIGAVGAATLVLVCILRYALLLAAVSRFDPAVRGALGDGLALAAAPVTGRAAMAALLWRVPVRPGGSLARSFTGVPAVVGAATLAVAAALALAGGARGLAALGAGLLLAAGWGWWWRRRFGGLTGDGIGAGGLFAETLALAVLA